MDVKKKQKTVSTSTTEAEFIALAQAVNETLWLQNLLEELKMKVTYPTIIKEDNQPTIAIVSNHRSPGLTKHIDVKMRAVQDYQEKGYILVQYVPTKLQIADALTKVTTNKMVMEQLLGIYHRTKDQGECYEGSLAMND